MIPKTDFTLGLKLSAYEKKLSSVASDQVTLTSAIEDEQHDFKAKLTYFTFSPYGKYTFP
jgi:hypothetical protein